MSHSQNSESSAANDPSIRVQQDNDRFLQQVTEQISLDTFSPTDQIMRQLVEGLGDPRGMVRLRFAETLGQIGEVATPFLLEVLSEHTNVVVRRAAAKTLTIIADPEAVPILVNAFLKDPDTVVKGSASGALARTGEAAVPYLLDILSSSEHPQETKGHAAWALAFMGSEAEDHLYQALNDSSLDVRCAVVGALGHVAQEKSDDKSSSFLVTALSDPEPLIRTEAAAALGQVKYPAAIPKLIDVLQDPELDVRKAAINSLGKMGAEQALEPLQASLHDDLEVIRVLAKLAIAQIERQSATDDW